MPMFTSLHELARVTTLTLLITAEGDQLRVNVTPRATGNSANEKPLYPLSLLASPEELDATFAEAVAIYEPGALSVLDQARAAASANSGSTAAALPAPARGKRGRGAGASKAEKAVIEDGGQPSTDAGEATVDPRQMTIDGVAASAGDAAETTGNTVAGDPASASDATATPESNAAASADAGIEAASASPAAEGLDVF